MARTISGSITTQVSLASGDSPVLVTGTINVGSGDAIYGPGGESWTITNARIITSANTAQAAGIFLGAELPVTDARVTNQAGGTIAGGEFGVNIYGPGYVINQASGGSPAPIIAGAISTQASVAGMGTITGTTLAGVSIYGGAGTVINYGLLRGGQYGVQEANGGSVVNGPGATIVGGGNGGVEGNSAAGAGVDLSGSAGLIDNRGTIAGGSGPGTSGDGFGGGDGVDLATGALTNSGSGIITGGQGGTTTGVSRSGGNGGTGILLGEGGTLVNNATITGGGGGSVNALGSNGAAGNGGYGVELIQAGTLINHSTIIGGQAGTIGTGGTGAFGTAGDGVYIPAAGSLINTGTITGGSGGSGGTGGAGALLLSSGTLNNTGTIIGGSGNLGGAGILMAGTGSLDNPSTSKVIGGAGFGGGKGGAGIERERPGLLTNEGTIIGPSDAPAVFQAGGTLINSGSIIGGAFLLTGTVTNQANGTITASGAYDAVQVQSPGSNNTVVNSGTLTSAEYDGVRLGGGAVTNNASGVVTGYQDAVYIYAAGAAVINSGSLLGGNYGVAEGNGGSVTNNASAVITGGTYAGVYIGYYPGQVTNAGSISGATYGVEETAGGLVTNLTGGTITGGGGTATSIVGAGVTISGGIGTVNNSGKISGDDGNLPGDYGTGGSGGDGVVQTAGTLTNNVSGTIAGGQGGGSEGAIGSNAGNGGTGVELTTGTLANAGTIMGGDGGHGGYAPGPGGNGGSGGRGIVLLQAGLLTNSGVIMGGAGGHGGTPNPGPSHGTGGNGGDGVNLVLGGTLVNHGVVTGGADGGSVYFNPGAAGAGVYLGSGASLANYGTITGGGNVIAAAGAMVTPNGSLTNHGTIIGGSGSNAGDGIFLAGTAAFDNPSDATAIGGDGGGPGGAGIYRATYGALTNEGSILGGNGSAGGAILKQGGSVINSGYIGGRQGVYIKNGGSVTNQASGVIAGSVMAAVLITGGSGGVVNAGSVFGSANGIAEQDGGSVTNSAFAFITASYGTGINIKGSSAATVVNLGTISGAVRAIYERSGGLVTNASGASISATSNSAIELGGDGAVINDGSITTGALNRPAINGDAGGSVLNNASIGGGVAFSYGTISVTNSAGATITANYQVGVAVGAGKRRAVPATNSGGPASTATIVNDSLIQSTNNYGIRVGSAEAHITNSSSAIISGSGGVYLDSGTLLNAGTISGDQRNGVYAYGGAATILNSGLILATDNYRYGISANATAYISNSSTATIAGGNGIYVHYGTLVNAGLISASHYYAISDFNGNLTVVNTGVILAPNGEAMDISGGPTYITNAASGTISSADGIYLSYGTVFNAGTITADPGSDAVYFESSGSTPNRVIAAPGAVFNGDVNGDVFELTSGASAGSLSGFGTSITNFDSLVFDKGSQWTVAGNDSATGLGTLGIKGFAPGDTIDLVGFFAVSKSFANNVLTLTDASSNTATLNIQGDFRTSDFVISGDDGTDIYLGPAGNYTWTTTGTADWNTAMDWDTGNVPSQKDNAVIGSAANALVTIASNEYVGINSLTLLPTETLLVSGTLAANTIVDNGVLTFAGTQLLDDTPVSLGGTIAEQGTNALTFGVNEVITQTGTSAVISGPPGGHIINQGVIDAAVSGGDFQIGPGEEFDNDGTILVSNGDTLIVDSDVGGTGGTIDIGANGVADFAGTVAASQTIDFAAAPGELILQEPGSVAADILDFGQGDTIDLASIAADSATWSNGLLTISSNGTTIAVLSLPGDYSGKVFSVDSDGAGGSAITLAISPPSISGTVANQAVANQDASTPLGSVTISDTNAGATDTVTVTLSDPANGTLSNLGGGSFNNGTYSITGTPSAVNAAIDGLLFTPTVLANGFVSTTTLAITAIGIGGTVSDSTTSVTSVEQVLGLATVPAGQRNIVAEPSGMFGAPRSGFTNEAVVTAPTALANFTLPTGYQAEYLGGAADDGLFDNSVGKAVLVGNTGNDTIIAAAANDTILGGTATNLLGGGNGGTILSNGAQDTVLAAVAGSLSAFVAGDDASVFGNFATTGDSLNVSVGGANATIVAGNSNTTATLSGTDGVVIGTFGQPAATLNVLINGSAGTVIAGDSATTVTASGMDAVIYGGFDSTPGALTVVDSGTADTVVAGQSATMVTMSGIGAVIYGGFDSAAGALNIVDSGTANTVTGGNSNAAITLQGSNGFVYGGFTPSAGTLNILDRGQGDIIVTGNDNATVTASGHGGFVVGGSGALRFINNAGDATVFGGSGPTSITGGTGTTAVLGSAGGVVTYAGSSGSLNFFAGSGNETLNGGGSSSNDQMSGGTDGTGSAVLIAGSGNDNLLAGAGTDTLTGGAGSNAFIFVKTFINGAAPQDVVTDFSTHDAVLLSGYGAGEAAADLASASSSAGNTTLTLSDGTRVTFLGVASASVLQGHVISG